MSQSQQNDSPFRSPKTISNDDHELTPQEERLFRVARYQRWVIVALVSRALPLIYVMTFAKGSRWYVWFFEGAWAPLLMNLVFWFGVFLVLMSVITCYGLSRQFLPRPPSILIALTQFVPLFSLLPQLLLIAIAYRCLKQHDLSPGLLGLGRHSLHEQLARQDTVPGRLS